MNVETSGLYKNGQLSKTWQQLINENCISVSGTTLYGGSDKTQLDGDLIIDDAITSIGNSAFQGCSSLTSVVIPDSVTSISYLAFYNCSFLSSIDIPDSVTSIDFGAFYGCSSLTSINIPDSVTSISYRAFKNCSSLTSIEISDNVTSIESEAFYGCSSLTSINIPDSVTSIGFMAFSGCSSLNSITVDGNNRFYDSRNDCNALIETSTNNLINGCSSTVIPDSVTSIGDYAFQNCSSLTSVIIPNGVTSIGQGAFQYCSSLTSINLPISITSIGFISFAGCTTLKDVYYSGSKSDRQQITINSSGNTPLIDAKWHYNHHTKPYKKFSYQNTSIQVQSAIETGSGCNIDAELASKQDKLTAGPNIIIKKVDGNTEISAVGGGSGQWYSEGTGINITGDKISVDTSVVATQTDLSSKQDTLTAGNGINITGDEISVDTTTIATKSELATKQDTLTFDNTPTQSSNNPVKSGGIYTELKNIREVAEGKTNTFALSYDETINFNAYVLYRKFDGTSFDSREELEAYILRKTLLNPLFEDNNQQIVAPNPNWYLIANYYQKSSSLKCIIINTDVGSSDLGVRKMGLGDNFLVKEVDVPDRWMSSLNDVPTFDALETTKIDVSANAYDTDGAVPSFIVNSETNESIFKIGKYLDFHKANSTADYDLRLVLQDNTDNNAVVNFPTQSGTICTTDQLSQGDLVVAKAVRDGNGDEIASTYVKKVEETKAYSYYISWTQTLDDDINYNLYMTLMCRADASDIADLFTKIGTEDGTNVIPVNLVLQNATDFTLTQSLYIKPYSTNPNKFTVGTFYGEIPCSNPTYNSATFIKSDK